MEQLEDPDALKELMRYLESGAPRATAMTAIGVSKDGHAEFKRLVKAGVSPQFELHQDMVQAEAVGECERLTIVAKSKDWRACMTSLERQFPGKYGQKIQLEVKQELEKVYSVIEAIATPQQYEEILTRIAGSENGEGPTRDTQERGATVH